MYGRSVVEWKIWNGVVLDARNLMFSGLFLVVIFTITMLFILNLLKPNQRTRKENVIGAIFFIAFMSFCFLGIVVQNVFFLWLSASIVITALIQYYFSRYVVKR